MSSPRYPHRRHGISHEEEKLWIGFYQRVHRDPALASELLALMRADAIMRREHLALYLCCRESLRVAHQRQRRDQHIARLLDRALLGPWRALRQIWQPSGAIAAQWPASASLPTSPPEALPPPTEAIPNQRTRKRKPPSSRNGRVPPGDAI